MGKQVDQVPRRMHEDVDFCFGLSRAYRNQNELPLTGAGCDASELRDAGFNAKELKVAGFNAMQLKEAGFDASQLEIEGLCDEGYELMDSFLPHSDNCSVVVCTCFWMC